MPSTIGRLPMPPVLVHAPAERLLHQVRPRWREATCPVDRLVAWVTEPVSQQSHKRGMRPGLRGCKLEPYAKFGRLGDDRDGSAI
jgi:hypothetical protein